MSTRLVTEAKIEARYRRERLSRYEARMHGGQGASAFKLRELRRGCDHAEARLRRAMTVWRGTTQARQP
jgi:hypothetical protein